MNGVVAGRPAPLELVPGQPSPRLYNHVVEVLRAGHYSRRTEEAYLHWIRRFALFHRPTHPSRLAEGDVNRFLTHLAVKENVAASTQNQALAEQFWLVSMVFRARVGGSRIFEIMRSGKVTIASPGNTNDLTITPGFAGAGRVHFSSDMGNLLFFGDFGAVGAVVNSWVGMSTNPGINSANPRLALKTVTNGTGLSVAGGISTSLGPTSFGQSIDEEMIAELTTIAAAAFTDTTIQIPANCQVTAVSVRVTVAIPTASTFDVGVSGATTRYGTGISVAANTTHPGMGDGVRFYGSAIAVRITPDLLPLADTGRVRVTIHYRRITPPTS